MTREQELIERLANTEMKYTFKDKHEVQEMLENLKRLLFVEKKCRTCKFFNGKYGKQPDGFLWGEENCDYGIWVMPMDIDLDKVSCSEWEIKEVEVEDDNS